MTISLWSYSYVRIRNAFLPLPAVNERVYTPACRTACRILAVMLPPSSTYSSYDNYTERVLLLLLYYSVD